MEFFPSLAHYFFPRHSNNHKAKLIHSSSLLILSFFLITYQLILNVIPAVGVKVLGYAANISTDEVIRLTNVKRTEGGVNALRYNSLLAQAARAKAEHMLKYDYWAHIAPDGTEPWKFFTDVGYKYRYAGENLARDFSSPSSAVDAWMASPTHKENLLSTKYTEIGVAVAEGDLAGVDTTIIVQFFGTPLSDTGNSQVAPAQAKPQVTQSPKPNPTFIVSLTPTALQPAFVQTLATLTPTLVETGAGIIKTLPPVEEKAGRFALLISPFQTTKGISIVTTVILLLVLVIDGVIVARRRLTRVGGRTFAHFAFLGMVLAILLIAKAGKIL